MQLRQVIQQFVDKRITYSEFVKQLKKIKNINAIINSKNETALLHAVYQRQILIVRALLEAGADPNKGHDKPLLIAANGLATSESETYFIIIQLLCSSNLLNVNIQTAPNEPTALHYVCKIGHYPTVQLLIKKQVNVNCLGPAQLPAIYTAVRCSHSEIVTLLCENGADILPRTVGNETISPLMISINHSETIANSLLGIIKNKPDYPVDNVIRCLHLTKNLQSPNLKKIIFNFLLRYGTPVHGQLLLFCALYNEVELLVHLVDHGCDPKQLFEIIDDQSGISYRSALHVAAQKNHVDIINLLLNTYGLDPNVLSSDGGTALCIAVNNGNIPAITAIINCNNSKNKTTIVNFPQGNESRARAIDVAAKNGDPSVIRALLENGAQIHLTEDSNFDAFYILVEFGHAHCIRLFLNYGLQLEKHYPFSYDRSEFSSYRCRAIHFAIRNNHESVFDELVRCGASLNFVEGDLISPLVYCIDIKGIKWLEKLVGLPVKIDEHLFGFRAIHFAIRQNYETAIKILCASANVNYIENDAFSPLILAIIEGSGNLVKLLLDNGANPNGSKFETACPLIEAITLEVDEKERLNIVRLLVDNKNFNADYFLDSKEIENPLLHAIKKGNSDIVSILLQRFSVLDSRIPLSPLLLAALLNRQEILQIILDDLQRKLTEPKLNQYINSLLPLINALAENESDSITAKIKNFIDKKSNPQTNVATSNASQSPIKSSPPLLEEQPYQFFTPTHGNTSKSGYSYLQTEMHLSQQQLEKLKIEIKLKKSKPKRLSKTTLFEPTEQQEYSWFEGALTSKSAQLIVNSEGKVPCYLWMPTFDEMKQQGCTTELYNFFNNKEHLKFGPKHIKKLSGVKSVSTFKIANKYYSICASHEFKIPRLEARILLYPCRSDDNSAILYIAGKFLKDGAHKSKDILSLLINNSHQSVTSLNLPESSQDFSASTSNSYS